MTLAMNRDVIAWSLGVVQPATIGDVQNFLIHVLKDERAAPSRDDIMTEISALVKLKDALRVTTKPSRYSLTSKGGHRLNKKLRHLRDQMRLFLLKHAYCGNFYVPSAARQDMDDASSSLCIGTENEDAQRPNARLASGQTVIWSLVSEQFGIGPTGAAADGTVPKAHPDLYSFDRGYFGGALKNTTDLAEAVGVSTRLITSIIKNKQKHYRSFILAKKSGGERKIHAPRTFLKVIQRWLADFLLQDLPVHKHCYAYRKGLSVKDNATPHIAKKYVLSMDIEDFFGNISEDMLEKLLIQNNYTSNLARTIAQLCTLDGNTPQGAPSSPILSNAILYAVDDTLTTFCDSLDLDYSRYADDISISGDHKENILKAKTRLVDEIIKAGFRINQKKTRIINRSRRQIITGVVVNEKVQPPRKYRRELRALLNNAKKFPEKFYHNYREIAGKVYYVSSFGAINNSKLKEYKETLRILKRLHTENHE